MLAIGANETQFNIKETGYSVTIPKNDYARLSYYLSCINSCFLENQPIPSYLTDYEYYKKFSKFVKQEIYKYACDLEPSKFPLFIKDNKIGGNKFFSVSIDQHSVGLAFSSSAAAIVGNKVNLATCKFMSYSSGWASTYYFSPLDVLTKKKNKKCNIF